MSSSEDEQLNDASASESSDESETESQTVDTEQNRVN